MINEKEYAKVIAVNLRNIMYERHLTQADLARDLNIWKCLRKPSQRSKICVNPNPPHNKKRPAKRHIQRSTGYFNAGSGGRTRTK
jgi:hypothetical protein